MRSVEVTVADSRWFSMGKAARHTTRRLRLPLLSQDPAGYLDVLIKELKSRAYDLLLPTFEESLLLAEYRDELERFTRLLLPDFETMWQVHDKPSLHRLCGELQIPTPPTVVPQSPSGLALQVASLHFPVVLKLPTANNCIGRTFCDSLPDLIRRFEILHRQESQRGRAPPFVQQMIDGDPIYTLMLCNSGRKLGEVIYRPLRCYPERGGTSAHRESVEHPEIAMLTDRLAKATQWSGFLGMDFIVDRRDGTPYLIDANPRANPGVQLGCLAGVAWSEILIDLLQGRFRPPVFAKTGIRARTFLLDMGWLLEGCRPQKNWFKNVLVRLDDFRHPAWDLAERNELQENGERWSSAALIYQAVIAIMTSLMTGRPIGQTLLDDVNYDPASADRLRATNRARNGLPSPSAFRQPAGGANRKIA